MRNLSNTALQSIHSSETSEVWVPLAVLSHPDWDEDLRFVADSQDLIHNGELFTSFPFTVTLPDETEDGLPVLGFQIDMVNRVVIKPLREVASVSGFVNVAIAIVLVSNPNNVEIGWLDLEMRTVPYNSHKITGTLTVEPILEAKFGYKTFTPQTAPALF